MDRGERSFVWGDSGTGMSSGARLQIIPASAEAVIESPQHGLAFLPVSLAVQRDGFSLTIWPPEDVHHVAGRDAQVLQRMLE